ncbi:MAG: shikimate dehydrogenase [Burkholderiaceae bacterium]|jgi:shikimate dehydrogenase|nr:shikimate dehydrogenase [Burkholderiaceae bacterium]
MPDRYAVIGHPIAHSQSPLIHGLFAQATGQALTYEAIDGGDQPGGFARALAAFRAAGGRGVNVTLPFKLEALACADAADDAARRAGAANALRLEDERIEARNFDGTGLVRDIVVNQAVPLLGARVLIVGAGGAARGAIVPLARAGAARIVIANRTADKARQLAAECAPHVGSGCAIVGAGLGGGDLGEGGGAAFNVVINATSASLAGAAPPIPDEALAGARLAYDMVYGKGLTPFLRQAQQAGAQQLADGIGMLVEQAAEAFAWWRGVRPDTAPVIARLAKPLV